MTNTETIIAIIVNTKTTKMTTTMVAFWHQLIIIFSHNGTTFGDKFFFDICVEYDNQTTYTNDIPYICWGKWSLHKGKIYSKEIMIRKTIIYWKQTLVREITHTITRQHDGTVVKLILQTQYYKRWKCNIHTFFSSSKKKVECNLKIQSQKRLYCDDRMWRRDLMLLRRRSIDQSMGMHYVVIT